MNRLAVVAVQEEENQLLCIAKTENSTGKVEADAVKEAIDNWGISDGVIACGFDTTSSNTGINIGGCVLLQQLLNRQLLWLACRHHIPELILKAAFQRLFGKTKGPVEVLFSKLKSSWKSLDLSNLSYPPTPACYRSAVDSLLEFLDDRLLPDNLDHLTRGDYKEFLELAKVCLGGSVERKKSYTYQLSRPGADHHARWMSKCLYILKFSLLQHQMNSLDSQTKKKIKTMASFILYVYIKYWFRSPSLSRAATDDLQMFQDLTTFKRVDKTVSAAALKVLRRHTWYLTEDSIPIALFNEDLDEEEQNDLAKTIGELPSTELEIRKPTLPTITLRSKIPDFVGPRSILIFNLLKIDHTFLLEDDWRETSEYTTMKTALANLHPVNDSAERALSMATTYNGRITKNEESFQQLMLVVESHRKKYGFKTKSDLKKLF